MLYKPPNTTQKGNGDSPKMKHKKNVLTSGVLGPSTQDSSPDVSNMELLVFCGGWAAQGDSKNTQNT